MTKTILVDVDTQHDFCDRQGALFVRGADALSTTFRALIDAACARGVRIVGSVDSHAFDAWEFAGATDAGPNGERPDFPPHCVKGTAGWLKVPGTLAPRARFVPNAPLADEAIDSIVHRGAPQQILLEKEVYSLFANPNADAVLARMVGEASPRFVVFGVALDYCVRAAALGLVDWMDRTGRRGECVLVVDATAAVDRAVGERALEECAARGVKLVEASAVLATMNATMNAT